MLSAKTEIDNPYWAAIQRLVRAGLLAMDEGTKTLQPVRGHEMSLNVLRSTHSPTVTDPQLVEWVAGMCSEEVVELDAGLALWSHLLNQYGKKVTAYDLRPAHPNHYPTAEMDRSRSALRAHGNATLVCMSSSYPYKSLLLALKRFPGTHLVVSADSSLDHSRGLTAILTREWERIGTTFGYCTIRQLREVHAFRKRNSGTYRVPGWNDTPTQLMPIVEPTGGDHD